jgi:hypothetical protein
MKFLASLTAAAALANGAAAHYIFQQLKVGSTQYGVFENSTSQAFASLDALEAYIHARKPS